MDKKRFAILFDLRRCNGCYACKVACKAEHSIPLGVFRILVNTYESGRFPSVKRIFIPTLCAQAGGNTPILMACSDHSIIMDENGIVKRNEEKPSYNAGEIEKIIGSDPYGGVFLHPYLKYVDFCDFCSSTRDIGSDEPPACVNTCNTGAIYFGDINNPESSISRYIKRWSGTVRCPKVGDLKVKVHLTEAIHPKVIAISNHCGRREHGRVATASTTNPPYHELTFGKPDRDIDDTIWWAKEKGGVGNGYTANSILQINPDPITGQQGWYDNIATINKV